MKHGSGQFTWESGNHFKGQYDLDVRNGYGEMFWSDGSTYKGDWVNGMQQGKGRLELPDGRVKEGVFRKNKYIGTPRQRDSPKRADLMIQAILE